MDKLRELDTSGDPQAKTVIADFDNTLTQMAQGDRTALPKALLLEREILDTVRAKFQLLDDYQFVDLRRLFEDRNRCAHPSFDMSGGTFRPSAEGARAHIRNAVTHVLQSPPVQGKAAIETILSKVRSRYFPSSLELVKQALKQQMERARPALVNGLVDRLIWDGFQPSSLYPIPTDIVALRALIELDRAVAEPRVRSQASKAMTIVSDDRLSIACSLVASLPEAFDGLAAVQRERFTNFLANGQIIVVAPILADSLDRPALRNCVLQRISGLNSIELTQVVAAGVRAEAVDQAVHLFANSKSFSSANHVSASLILPLIEHITPDHVRTIVRSPTERNSDLRYASGMAPFVAAVRERTILPGEELDELLMEHGFDYLLKPDG